MIRAGEEGRKPEQGQEVVVKYEGRLEDGTIFDSSDEHGEPLKINIGTGQVIDGWDMGILEMTLGEKADLVIKAKYGYGEMGSPPKIPGGATLIFTIELLEIAQARPTRWQMTDQQLIEYSLRLKEDANIKFKAKKYKEAEGLYRDALSHVEAAKIDNEELRKLRVTLYQNLSVTLNNAGDYRDTVHMCCLALALDGEAVKALYLRSVAYRNIKQYDEAMQDIKAAIKLSPKDKKLREEYEKLKSESKNVNTSQAALMKNFFSEGIYNEKEAPKVAEKYEKLPEFSILNAQVYFDIVIGKEDEEEDQKIKGRVVFELFTKEVPKTAENFRALCTGEKGENLTFKGNAFHRVIKGFMAQGGDITHGTGTGGMSIYGPKFEDEKIWYPHTHRGLLSMANSGPDTNSSQFFICFKDTPHLNDKHTCFGRVIHNYSLIEKIEENPTGAQDKPLRPVTIVDCGELDSEERKNGPKDFLIEYTNLDMNLTDFHVQKEFEDDDERMKQEEDEEDKEDIENKPEMS